MAARFNPAPGWPSAPRGWLPPAGWQPDPSWPSAPADWPLVVHDTTGSTDPAVGATVEEARPRTAASFLPTTTRTSRGRMLNLLRGRVSQ